MINNSNIVGYVNKLRNIIYLPRLNSIFKSTLCFFYDNNNQLYNAAGSGLFLKYKENYYVITAAHVLAEHFVDTYVIIKDEAVTIGGVPKSSPMPATNDREDDKIDISIIKVDAGSAEKLLNQFTPVTQDQLELNHSLKSKSRYTLVGYPLNHSKVNWGANIIKSLAQSYQSSPYSNYDYQRDGFSDGTTIAIKYDGFVTNAKAPNTHKSPKLIGISGCGLWYLGNKDKNTLVGVVIGKKTSRNDGAILATKIDVVVEMIETIR